MAFRVPTQQYSFTSGMLDDTLEARSDIRAYYAGAREIQNMLGLPQGGVDMRGGLAFVAEIPEASSGVRMATFEFSTEQKYLHVFTDQKLHVYKDDVKQVEIATPWTGAQLGQIDWTQSLDTMIMVHPDVKYRKVMRQGAHNAWDISELSISNIPQYDFDGDGQGVAEDTWSDARGWPRSVYLFEGRLFFGGSKSRPQTIWGSSSNNFFDFKVTTPNQLDDDSVEMTMDNDRVSAVEQLYALDDFFSFTSGGLFVQTESPITPENFYFARNSELPAANIRPVELDGSVAFIRRGADGHHQSLHELVYDDAKQIYTTQDLALLASNLMRSPVSMAARLGNESDSANHLFVINGDGTVAVLNTRKSQQITGWTLVKTDGVVMDCSVVGNTAYFLIKRTVNGAERYFIEKLDSGHVLDASVKQTSGVAKSVWDGLDHLNGRTVNLYGNAADLGESTVADGQVTTPFDVTSLEVGLAFDWVVETMPIEARLADGTLIGNRHRITRATIRMKNTQAMTVNNRPVAFTKFGDDVLDAPPQSFTGLKTVRFLGWTGGRDGKGATIRMDGKSTRRATILSVTAEVAQ